MWSLQHAFAFNRRSQRDPISRRAAVSHLHSGWSISLPALECVHSDYAGSAAPAVLLFKQRPLDSSALVLLSALSPSLSLSRPSVFLHFIAPSSILLESLTVTHQATSLALSGQSIRSIISIPPPDGLAPVRWESLYNVEKKTYINIFIICVRKILRTAHILRDCFWCVYPVCLLTGLYRSKPKSPFFFA